MTLETTMDLTVKVLNANGTENIQLFRGDKHIGLDHLTDHEKEILICLAEELIPELKKPKTFKQQYLDGEAEISEIDDFVESWHKNETTRLELDEFLGLSFKEYAAWVEQGENELARLLKLRKDQQEG